MILKCDIKELDENPRKIRWQQTVNIFWILKK